MIDVNSAAAASGGEIVDSRGVRYYFEYQRDEAERGYRFEDALHELRLYTEAAPRHLADLADASRVARLDTFGPAAWRRIFRQNPGLLALARRSSPTFDALAAEFPDYFSPLDV